jgi:threonine synthase
MQLQSTRDKNIKADALEAVLKGIAEDGGLFVPSGFPKLSMQDLKMYADVRYPELAADILAHYFDEMDIEQLQVICRKGYANFGYGRVAPVKKLNDTEFVMELWHGPTSAFKDMALQVLPGLLHAAKTHCREEKNTLILVATSGDTGKAALEGFMDAPGVSIMVFYPDEGVSALQKLQMVTQEGGNTHVAAVKGNFDDAQTGVKEIFADRDFAALLFNKGYTLSSANSINFGRLAPQIAYYVNAYVQLIKSGDIAAGEPVNFAVPTGNFGNILAGYYAKQMGLPVNRLICASNRNNVLTDFFESGEYQSKRPFYKTSSPSMDILISSNLERLLFEITGRDGEKVAAWMEALKENGAYAIDPVSHENLKSGFYAGWSPEDRSFAAIKTVFEKYRYLLDPHTAVAQAVYEDYLAATGDTTKTVVVSTASPYKFCPDVLTALEVENMGLDDFAMMDLLSGISGWPVPQKLKELKTKSAIHTAVVDKSRMKETVADLIK